MDVIRLKEITVFPKLGVGDLEKEWVQKVTLDVELHLDLLEAGRRDDLHRTVDYQRVYETVREISETGAHHLIEALALRIGETLRERFGVARVVVRVRKLSLPFDANLNCVEVELSVPRE
ncbi:MAG: dihydroneopterin aldolase [Candidatus Eisenbacteria bacterium]|nr:dihydroneopterin aldolase [Candidatus Eisenbacteria bacterium]